MFEVQIYQEQRSPDISRRSVNLTSYLKIKKSQCWLTGFKIRSLKVNAAASEFKYPKSVYKTTN